MKKSVILLLCTLWTLVLPLPAKTSKTDIKVQPAFWWSGMKQPSLQLMLRGENVGKCQVDLKAEGVRIDSIYRPNNTNYLFIYLDVSRAVPQKLNILLRDGKKQKALPYELRERDQAVRAQGFDAADVLYLLMPDRFVNGNPGNDVVKGLKEAYSGPEPNARHGGDLDGMRVALPYLKDLGVTAVWPTPLQVNDMPETSYHGYAITDYYEIDPRYGSNETYRDFIKEAHSQGIKVVQDMVFNHCGSENFLFRDLPDSTWFNNHSRYVQTSYKISAVSDPYASSADARNAQDGWFVSVMPDLNQRNPHVMKYLVQNSIWWVEYAGIDAIRQDTYPYADRAAMAEWCRALKREYPRFNIVGETWLNNNVGVSYWQKDSKLAGASDNSELPTVMDFPLMSLLNSALDEETNDWDRGLARIYDYLSQDAVYADPTHLLTFLSNHDTDRFARVPRQAQSAHRYKQGIVLLLTLRGIPQLYYGDELAMAANKSRGDGELRAGFPGGFAGDSINALTGKNLTPLMKRTHDLTRRLLQWRKGNEAISKGTFRHYAVKDGVYVYARQYKGRTVTVILNGRNEPVCLDLARYAEVLPAAETTDILTGRKVRTDQGTLQLGIRETLVLDF